MGTYKSFSFDNEYHGKTNIIITDRYSVQNAMPGDFQYYIKVNAGRSFVPSSVNAYAALLAHTVLINNTIYNTAGECVFLCDASGIFEDIAAGQIVRHDMTYSFENTIRRAYSDDIYTESNTTTRTNCPYYQFNAGLMSDEIEQQHPFNIDIEFSTNMPFFETGEEAVAYRTKTGDQRLAYLEEHCINFGGAYNLDTQYYHIYNNVGEGEQVRNTVTPTGDTSWRSLVFNANSVPVMYYMSDSYELVLKATDVVSSYYLPAPASVIHMVPENEWDTGLVAHGVNYGTLPSRLEATGVNLPDGIYDYGFSLDTNIYIFKDAAAANAALESGDFSGAVNYSGVSQGNSYVPPSFGQDEQNTTFGHGADTSPFTSSYVLTRQQLLAVARLFYTNDATLMDNIMEGLKLYGAKPVDAIAGLTLYPFDITEIVNTSGQNYMYWGSYKMDLDFNIQKVYSMLNAAYLDCGTIFLRPLFYSYLDYEPYTTLSVYLPFIGWQKVDIRPLIGKYVSVRYYIDIHTRACVAVILASGSSDGNGVMIAYYTGTIGVCLPVSASDFQAYANSALNSILQTAGGVVSGASTAIGAAGTIAAGGAMGVAGGAVAAGGIAAAGLSLAGGLFDMEKMGKPRDHAVTKGNYTSGIGCYMPQYIIWRYDIHEAIEPDGLAGIYGKPSSASGNVGSFSGYLKVRSAKLNTTGMTDTEANEVASLLKSGIYI